MMTEDVEKLEDAAVNCRRCAAFNPPRRKFCVKCGAPLRERCPQCQTECTVSDAYCDGCGVNLDQLVADQVQQIEADFRAVEELRLECQFDKAIALLIPISKNHHPRLVDHTSRAGSLISELVTDRDQQRTIAEEFYQEARRCLESFNYQRAAEILERIPPPLRHDAIKDLYVQIESRRQEIAMLNEETHAAVREKRLVDLPSLIDRLLALVPDHAYAKKLAEQMQERLMVAAMKQLTNHQYDSAVQLLRQMAPSVHNPQAQSLYEKAMECAWLTWDLRNAPLIDDTLAAVAGRLRQLAPADSQAAKLAIEIQKRTRAAKTDERPQSLLWARPPKQTALGIPVEGLTGFQRLILGDSANQPDLRRQPGRFAVACGLALAGIKQSALPINLLSAQQQGVLHRVKRLTQPQIAVTRKAWGLDMGVSGLKAVRLAWNKSRQQAVIEAAELIEHAKLLTYAANDIEKRKITADTLDVFLDRHQIKSERLCAALPGRLALSRQIQVPPIESAKLTKLVQLQAPGLFPFPLEQLAWDFQVLADDPPQSDGAAESPAETLRQAVLIAARDATVEHFLDTFEEAGIRVDLLQTDCVALHNYLAYEHFATSDAPLQAKTNPVVAALAIGGETTNIVVSSPQSFWSYTCGVAGHSFTRALVKEFNLTVANAEQLKRTPESASRLSDMYRALSPVFADLLKELQRALAAYAKAQPDRLADHIIGLGGGFALHGLFRYLRCGR